MPEEYRNMVNRVLRDHEGYTGDGRGGVGELPVGDRSTARKAIDKRDLRAVFLTTQDSVRAAVVADADRAEAAANTAAMDAANAVGPMLADNIRANVATDADRAEAARDSAVATAHYAVVSSVSGLRALSAAVDGDVARVIGRQGGYFKFQMGDLTAQVASDPGGGLWVAPASAPTGASGAWQRMVEKGIYDAEWWLPDVMPTNAQTLINPAILAIPDPYARFLMPRREVLLTGAVRYMKGFTYEGAGEACPLNGQGGNFIVGIVGANNARLHNISAGNVQGQVIISEAAGFAIHDGAPLWQSSRVIENVSFRDCHSFDVEVGLSATVSALNKTTGGSPSFEHDVELFAPRDVYIENFCCDGAERIGIEIMRTNGCEVIGGKLIMKIPDPVTGFDRGVRIAGAHNVHLSGVHVVAPDTTSVWGVSVEPASQGGGGEFPYTYGASSNVTVENCTMEDCDIGGAVTGGFSRNIRFSGNLVIGRRDNYGSSAFMVDGNATSNGFALEETPHLNVEITENRAFNVSNFMRLAGYHYGTKVSDNAFISNALITGVPYAQCFIYASTANHKAVEMEVSGNRGVGNSMMNIAHVNMQNMTAGSVVTIDDNSFTPSSTGNLFSFTGDIEVRMKGPNSNRKLPVDLWELIRPPLDQEDYPVGDGHLISGIY